MELEEKCDAMVFKYQLEERDPMYGALKFIQESYKETFSRFESSASRYGEICIDLEERTEALKKETGNVDAAVSKIEQAWKATRLRALLSTVLLTTAGWLVLTLVLFFGGYIDVVIH